MKLSKNMIIGTIILSIAFSVIRYLNSSQEVKWSEEAKTIAMGICAFQYLDSNNHPTNWSLAKIENNDKIGFQKISNCSIQFESKYDPQEFFNTWKSNTIKITSEARTYLH